MSQVRLYRVPRIGFEAARPKREVLIEHGRLGRVSGDGTLGRRPVHVFHLR